METIKDIVLVIISLGVVSTILGMLFKLSNKIGKFEGNIEKINDNIADIKSNVKTLPCDKHEELINLKISTLPCDRHEEAMDIRIKALPCNKHTDLFSQIKEDLSVIRTLIVNKNPVYSSLFSEKHSPRALNPLGLKYYKEINGDEFLEKNLDLFMSKIENRSPKTALDVEVAACDVLIESINLDLFNEIKNWLYSSPEETLEDGSKLSLSIGDVCYILSLPLRDKYLSLHSDILP